MTGCSLAPIITWPNVSLRQCTHTVLARHIDCFSLTSYAFAQLASMGGLAGNVYEIGVSCLMRGEC